jgi:HEAT repeat protein
VGAWLTGSGALDRARGDLQARASWRRALAAYALGDMASRSSVGDLVGALDDESRDVRAAAARSLGRLGAVDAVKPLLLAQAERRVPRTVVGQALLAIDQPAVPALLLLADADGADTRAGAVELVGLIGGGSEGRVVVGALRDASAEVRAQAARALGRLGAGDAAAALRIALDDRIEFVRAAAAEALGEIGDDAALEALVEMAERDGFDAARAAAHAVVRIDPSAATHGGPFLVEAIDMAAL